MSGPDPTRQRGVDETAAPPSNPSTTSVNSSSRSLSQQPSPLSNSTSTAMDATSNVDASEIQPTSANITASQVANMDATASTSPIPPLPAATSQSTSAANGASSASASQSSHPAPFGPPRPPVSQPSPQRTNAEHTHSGTAEGVIHDILEGIFGPMANIQATATGSSNQGPAVHWRDPAFRPFYDSMPNADRNGQAAGNNAPLGTMFSMFGSPPSMPMRVPTSGAGLTNAAEQPAAAGSRPAAQQNPSSNMASGSNPGNGSQGPPHPPFPSEFTMTFDISPMDIPGFANFGNPAPNANTAGGENLAGSRGGPGLGAGSTPSSANNSAAPGAPSDQNRHQQPQPLAFIIGPNGTWMQPNIGPNNQAGGNGAPNPEANGNPTAGENAGQPAQLLQIFSRLFPNGLQPGVNMPGTMNFAFGLPSFMQTRLPPDPERAEELLRGLKDPGMDSMMRLDRVVRADNDGAADSGGEGDADGWKCAVCMEGLEDEFEAHKQQAPASEDAEQVEVQQDGLGQTERVSRNPSISSDLDMHDVEMVLNGEARENPRNKTSLKVFPCHHVFHSDCLRPWLAQKTTCPTCRFDIDPHSVTLRRPVMPQGRNNPLRPRARNAATSNVRATPYSSRPISPPVRNPGDENHGPSPDTSASSVPAAATAGDNASSNTPAFTQTDAPRSPFAFPRPERDAQSQTNIASGHVDRPPPAAQSQQSSDTRDANVGQGQNGFAPMDQENGANVVLGDMQEAVRMLQELIARNNRERRSSPGNGDNQGGPSQANLDPVPGRAAGNDAQHSDHGANNQQHDQNTNNNHASEHHEPQHDGRANRNQPRTIAIFEIALPDMSADMMPDTFQGSNDNGPQAFGPGAFQSFMIPFPNMAGGQQGNVSNGSDATGGQDANSMDVSEDARPPMTSERAGNASAGANIRSSSGDANATSSGSTAQAEGRNPAPPHPGARTMHRWLSDPDRRQAPFLNFPILPPMNQRTDSEAPPIERRRGDETWNVPKVKESFTEWITSREKALHWRCDDPVCLYAPPEHPYTELTEEQWREWKPTDQKLIKINSYKQHRFIDEEYTGPRPVCQHDFHPDCLKVSCLSSNWWYREPGREETTVRCPKCRTQGWIVEQGGEVQHGDVASTPSTTTV